MLLTRKLNRRLNRSLDRPVTHWLNSGARPAPPNYISRAIAACRRVVRARRRLMKLAPEDFDAAVVDRRAREAAESEAIQAEFRSAIARIYGVEESALPPRPVRGTVRRNARTQAAIARELSAGEAWLTVARESLQQFRQRRPHTIPSLSQIAGLVDVASRLGRLSTGLETTSRAPSAPPEPNVSFRDALQRIYGDKSPSVQAADTKVNGS
jgi:hypothetical protein